MSRLQESLLVFRKNILTEAGNDYYSNSGTFFDMKGINLNGLGFDESKTTDSITIEEVDKKMNDVMYNVNSDERKFKRYKKLKEYIQLKNRIGELNLPEDVKSIKDRSEYQKEVLYHFIMSKWKKVNDELQKGEQSIPKDELIIMLNKPLSETVRLEICGGIPSNVLREIELRYASELSKNLEIGGSTRKRKSSTRRRRPSRKSSATKRRRSRRPHRRTSRK